MNPQRGVLHETSWSLNKENASMDQTNSAPAVTVRIFGRLIAAYPSVPVPFFNAQKRAPPRNVPKPSATAVVPRRSSFPAQQRRQEAKPTLRLFSFLRQTARCVKASEHKAARLRQWRRRRPRRDRFKTPRRLFARANNLLESSSNRWENSLIKQINRGRSYGTCSSLA